MQIAEQNQGAGKPPNVKVKSAPTPGPWAYYQRLTASENHKGFGVFAILQNEKRFIADVSPVITDESGDASDEGTANASLIANAPDHALLLAAICAGIARWEPATHEIAIAGLRYSVDIDNFGCPALASHIRRAIAKATGA